MKEFNLTEVQFLGSKSIQRQVRCNQLNANSKFDYLDSVMIPDFSLILGKLAFLFELENTNSYQQFEQKINGYEEMLLKKDSPNFFTPFQGKNIQLIVATREAKKLRYEEILS